MVRTKADRVPTKAVGSKAPGKIRAATPGKKSNGRKSAGKSYGGGNPYHPRETPEWQKPITSFMNMSTSSKTTDNNESSESSTKEKIENQASNLSEDPNAEESATEEEDDDDETD